MRFEQPTSVLFFQGLDRDRNPLQLPIDDDVSTNDTLEPANQEIGFAEFEQFTHDDQSIAWNDRVAKSNFFQAPEAHHGVTEQLVLVRAIAADLGYRFEHDDAGHQGHPGHVSAYPELVVGDIFVPDACDPNRIFVDDRGELFHFETLRVVFADLRNVRDDAIEIDGIWIDNEIFQAHKTIPSEERTTNLDRPDVS